VSDRYYSRACCVGNTAWIYATSRHIASDSLGQSGSTRRWHTAFMNMPTGSSCNRREGVVLAHNGDHRLNATT
jgi:hypothetical protein